MELEIYKLTEISNFDILSIEKDRCKIAYYAEHKTFINRLLEYDNYPLQNKTKAITNILDFLIFFRNKMDSSTNELNVSKKLFTDFFGTKEYVKYVKILEDLRIVYNIPNIINGQKYVYVSPYKTKNSNLTETVSKRFKLSKELDEDDEVVILKTKNTRGKKIIVNEIDNIKENYLNVLTYAKLDITNAYKDEVEKYYTDLKKGSLIKRLNNIFPFYTGDKNLNYGTKVKRIYHYISNISKISRKHISYNNKKFNNIDITNAQPTLLLTLLNKNGLSYDAKYKEDVLNGVFYEQFLNRVIKISNKTEKGWKNEERELTRDDVKVELYKSVFFSFNTKININSIFKEIYPTTWESLSYWTKAHPEIEMATNLQNLEAEIINNVNVDSDYFTLFDAIYFTDKEEKQSIINQIKAKFEATNIKIKKLTFNDEKINV